MKEEFKAKEGVPMNMEPMGMMPELGAMPQMQAMPPIQPIQQMPDMAQMAQMQTMSMMPQIPQMPPMGIPPQMVLMCCPYLMNTQCPMMYNQGMVGGMPPMGAAPFMPQLPQTQPISPLYQYKGYPDY